MKKVIIAALVMICITAGTAALAVSGIGQVAAQVTSSLTNIAKLITAASYVAGMAFAVAAIVKFKAHKDNPTQVPLSMGIVLLFVAVALIFLPSVFQVAGHTMFGGSGYVAGPSGVAKFGGAIAPSGS